MSQGVDRLKQLLFETETREITDLARRIEAVARQGTDGHDGLRREVAALSQATAELSQKLGEVFTRAGSNEHLEEAVAGVLDGAVRRAEAARHVELASAMAPLVVRTVKTEIRNSQDEIVEAIYPMTGRMVKAYVASALKDLANDINRRLEQNAFMLRLRSITSGRSVAELALADAQRLRLEELYLIRRGSGELVARWPEDPATEGRDHMMSGVLTAINEFSSEAFQEDGSSLRKIDLGERELYLRASPVYLLAAKCSGRAEPAIEAALDEAFLSGIERLNSVPEETGARREVLTGLFGKLETELADQQAELAEASAGVSPVKALAWIIGLPLAAWLGWTFYADWRTSSVERTAARIVAESEPLRGYPAKIDVERFGTRLKISGLTPNSEARTGLLARLRAALPQTQVEDALTVLPNNLAAIEPELSRVGRDVAGLSPEIGKLAERVDSLAPVVEKAEAGVAALKPALEKTSATVAALEAAIARDRVTRNLDAAERRIAAARSEVAALAKLTQEAAAVKRLGEAASLLDRAGKAVASERAASLAPATGQKSADLALITKEVMRAAALVAAGARPAEPSASPSAASDDVTSVLAAETERLLANVQTAVQLAQFKASLPSTAPSARDSLERWTRANAIFFEDEARYHDEARATRDLDTLAALVKDAKVLVRVVGYTDGQGGQARNSPLSEARATKVRDELVARGVEPRLLVALGRLDLRDISPGSGASSPNRRVEFEIGFDGESAR